MVEVGSTIIGATFVKTKQNSFIDEPFCPNLLGPFSPILRWSGLYCPKSERDNGKKAGNIFQLTVAGGFLIALLCRTILLMNDESKVTTLKWAASNVLAFTALASFISAVCVFSWCRSNFMTTFNEMLTRLRMIRIQQDPTLEDYSSAHKKASVFCLFIFIVTLATSVNEIMVVHFMGNENTTRGDKPTTSPLIIIDPLLDFLSSLAMSLSIIYYLFVNLALNREVKHFNKELSNAARFQQLTMPHMLNIYSKRQSDILQLIKFANSFMTKYTTVVPMFVVMVLCNAIYVIGGLRSEISSLEAAICVGWIVKNVALIVICFLPAAKIQDNIKETGEILMHDDVLHSCGDEQQHRVYRVMLDRCYCSNTQLYLMNAVPLTTVQLNLLMFIAPNIATLMVILKKLELY